MKARIPKNPNRKINNSDYTMAPSSTPKFSELLQIIEEDFNKLYEKYGKDQLLAIANTLMSSKYIKEIGVPKHSVERVRAKVLSLLENSVTEIARQQYKRKTESGESLPLNVLYSMSQPTYVQPIDESRFSDEIKNAAKNGVTKAVYAQAEQLGMSKEEFDSFKEDPKEFIKKKKEEKAKELAEKESTTSATDQKSTGKTFFDRVNGYTHGFRDFLIPPAEELSIRPKEKFEDYEQYLKFKTFKTKLQTYATEHKMNELQVIDKILSKKSKEFSEIDEDFVKILSARKSVILEQEKDDQEK